MDEVTEVVFKVDGTQCALSEPEARILGEKLRGFAAGQYEGDVAELAAHGIGPRWVDGARALADAIEDVITTTRQVPIPLDGKAAGAAYAVLAGTPSVASDATSGQSRLYEVLRARR